jgi:thioredoxin-related protein
MKHKLIHLLLIFCLILSACSMSASQAKKTAKKNESVAKKDEEVSINWLSYDEAAKLNAKKPKKIFVDVYTDWCGWCKQLDKTSFRDPAVVKYMNKQYYAVKLNAESNDKVTYQGKEMTAAQLARNTFHATGYPTTVYLDERENLLQPLSGYLEAEMLNKILHFYGDNHYKTTSWDNFQMVYTNPE